jgi:hypothetical protein
MQLEKPRKVRPSITPRIQLRGAVRAGVEDVSTFFERVRFFLLIEAYSQILCMVVKLNSNDLSAENVIVRRFDCQPFAHMRD